MKIGVIHAKIGVIPLTARDHVNYQWPADVSAGPKNEPKSWGRTETPSKI
ncbi:MAG TPA: hypothetical protein VEC75_08770 [Stellaceae bacterium]|nr:hypothetical protein [Stellaceae bacterium]HYC14330.1 hypothetical protein [Stellaceae bacterium]